MARGGAGDAGRSQAGEAAAYAMNNAEHKEAELKTRP
ncbi:hypothetical protein HY30_02625 [Hyphomonas chukchiensis]|uniref:Uncharacterized protein n=1 Tax=Hyphomonas chukchiensis TaxID=1280947 RepID=A0A062UH37_9PROT|nr:hypothetical protein HY30_02625 [Hyphomonas chukchiensis]